MVGFVRKNRPDLAGARGEGRGTTQPQAPAAAPVAQSPIAQAPISDSSGDSITDKVLAVVADKTGYPKDMLELDLDLEADLGIDTVKQAETFATMRETFNSGAGRAEPARLSDAGQRGRLCQDDAA